MAGEGRLLISPGTDQLKSLGPGRPGPGCAVDPSAISRVQGGAMVCDAALPGHPRSLRIPEFMLRSLGTARGFPSRLFTESLRAPTAPSPLSQPVFATVGC